MFESAEWFALTDEVRLLAVRIAGLESRLNMATTGPETALEIPR